MQFVNSKKKRLPVGTFFSRIPSPRILRQVGRMQMLRSSTTYVINVSFIGLKLSK